MPLDVMDDLLWELRKERVNLFILFYFSAAFGIVDRILSWAISVSWELGALCYSDSPSTCMDSFGE